MKSRWNAGALVPGWLLAACFASHAGEPIAAAPATVSPVASSKVGIDPVTGQRRPLSDAESRALDEQNATALRQDAQGAARLRMPATESEAKAMERRYPNGVIARKLPASYMSAVTATPGASGHIAIGHDDANAAAAPSTTLDAARSAATPPSEAPVSE